MALPNELFYCIQRLIATLGQESVQSVVKALNRNANAVPDRNTVVTAVVLPEQRMSVGELYDCWRTIAPDVSSFAVGVAIESADRTRRALIAECSEALVWTGPSVTGAALRRTDQALQEVIQFARRDLLIVTFAAYKVPIIVEALTAALRRGVSVRFVAEAAEDGAKVSFDAIQALGSDLANRCEVYVWPRDHRPPDSAGKFGSLHAKVAVADASLMLLSSANLTDYALSLNMEMGVLIRGGELPKRAAATFYELIHSGVLVRK